ncbi:MAG: hypothetical protein S4CHLAM81_01420 [Chlamydiales bacterium]|nr:hypothetical protein [Chlamydiales bacterium]MCH9634938.1 hypothetical protein [Chlamydiales bacterium]
MAHIAITESQLSRESAKRSDHLHEAIHKGDDKKQVPVEHHGAAHLNAILVALMAMQDQRILDQKTVQVESQSVAALSVQMSGLNKTLAGMDDYASIDKSLKGDKLTEAIENMQTQNESLDARRSMVQGQYGNDKLEVQQRQSSMGADVNAVVQQLQQAAGLLNQVSQLASVVSGR